MDDGLVAPTVAIPEQVAGAVVVAMRIRFWCVVAIHLLPPTMRFAFAIPWQIYNECVLRVYAHVEGNLHQIFDSMNDGGSVKVRFSGDVALACLWSGTNAPTFSFVAITLPFLALLLSAQGVQLSRLLMDVMEALSTDSLGGTARASKRLSMLDTAHLRASLYRDSASDCTFVLLFGRGCESMYSGVVVHTAHARHSVCLPHHIDQPAGRLMTGRRRGWNSPPSGRLVNKKGNL